jgi:ABC-type multidrug transport system fused ATPase/permease subunit
LSIYVTSSEFQARIITSMKAARLVRQDLRAKLARPFGQRGNPEQKAHLKAQRDILMSLLKVHKWKLLEVMVLTGLSSGIYMGLPYMLQGINMMMNMKIGEPRDPTQIVGKPVQIAEESAFPRQTDPSSISYKTMAMDFGSKMMQTGGAGENRMTKFDFQKIRELIRGKETIEKERAGSPVYTKKEIDNNYRDFTFVLVSFFGIVGSLGYYKHMKIKRLEDMYAILLKQKLFGELITRKYSTFLAKNSNSGAIAQKINANVTTFTSGLVEHVTGLVRGATMSCIGSVALFYMLPKFTLMTMGLVVALGLSSKVFNARIVKATKEQTEGLNNITTYIGDQTSNVQQVKILVLNNRSKAELTDRLKEYHIRLMRVASLWGWNMALFESNLI